LGHIVNDLVKAIGGPISSYQIQTRKLGLIVSIQMRNQAKEEEGQEMVLCSRRGAGIEVKRVEKG
jgi:hypothetical protein